MHPLREKNANLIKFTTSLNKSISYAYGFYGAVHSLVPAWASYGYSEYSHGVYVP